MSGSSEPTPSLEYIETGQEPEFFVTHTRIEQAGNGNLRMFCYAERHSAFVLLYTVVIPAMNLMQMARRDMTAAADAHNIQMWDDGNGRNH